MNRICMTHNTWKNKIFRDLIFKKKFKSYKQFHTENREKIYKSIIDLFKEFGLTQDDFSRSKKQQLLAKLIALDDQKLDQVFQRIIAYDAKKLKIILKKFALY